MSKVVLGFACRSSAWAVATSTPFAASRDANVARRSCSRSDTPSVALVARCHAAAPLALGRLRVEHRPPDPAAVLRAHVAHEWPTGRTRARRGSFRRGLPGYRDPLVQEGARG